MRSSEIAESLTVLDMSDDVDQKPDENGEKAKFDVKIIPRFCWSGAYTHASLEKAALPDAFTFCTAYMVFIIINIHINSNLGPPWH